MTHHSILENHPVYIAIEQKIRDLDRAENAWRKRSRAAADDDQRRLAEHRQAKTAALLAGEPPPPEPQPSASGGPDEARLFLEQKQLLRDQRRGVLADIAPEVEDAARARMAEITAEARPLIAEMESLAAEADQLVAAVRSCLLPKERSESVPAGQGIGDRMRHTVTVLDLAAAVVDGFDLLDPVAPDGPKLIAASFEAPEKKPPSQPSPTRDRSPSPLQVKGA